MCRRNPHLYPPPPTPIVFYAVNTRNKNTRWSFGHTVTMADIDGSRADSEGSSEGGVSRAGFHSNVQDGANEKANISAAVTDLRDEVTAQLAAQLVQLMDAIRTGPSNGALPGWCTYVGGYSGGAGDGADVLDESSGGALSDVPLPNGGTAGFGPPGQGIASISAFASPPSPSQGVGQVLGNPQLGFGPYRGGSAQSPKPA